VNAIEIELPHLVSRFLRSGRELLDELRVLLRLLRLQHLVEHLLELDELHRRLEVRLDDREERTYDIGAREHALPRHRLRILDPLRQLALVLRREQLVLGQLTEVRCQVIIGVARAHRTHGLHRLLDEDLLDDHLRRGGLCLRRGLRGLRGPVRTRSQGLGRDRPVRNGARFPAANRMGGGHGVTPLDHY